MKIRDNLPQFKGQKGLLVVAAEHGAQFYHAHNGMIGKVTEFEIENPHYSDREGQFMSSGHGATIRTGAVYENKKDKVHQDFTKELAAQLAHPEVVEGVEIIYVFAPTQLKQELEKAVPNDLKDKISGHCWGNYLELHPLKLLEKIQGLKDENDDSDDEMSAEARKILEQTD